MNKPFQDPDQQAQNLSYYHLLCIVKEQMDKVRLKAQSHDDLTLEKDIPSVESKKKQSIATLQSSFLPFKKSFQQDNFIQNLFSESDILPPQPSYLFEDPTEELFTRLQNQSDPFTDYSLNQIALAKCHKQLLWPCKIISIEKNPQMDPENTIYQVKFIYQNSVAPLKKNNLVKFNEESLQEMRKVSDDKKLLMRALKLAEKYWRKKLKAQDSQNNEISTEKMKQINKSFKEYNRTQIELSLSFSKELIQQKKEIIQQKPVRQSIKQIINAQKLQQRQDDIKILQPKVLNIEDALEIDQKEMKSLYTVSLIQNAQNLIPNVEIDTKPQKIHNFSPKHLTIQTPHIYQAFKVGITPQGSSKPINIVIETPKIDFILKYSEKNNKEELQQLDTKDEKYSLDNNETQWREENPVMIEKPVKEKIQEKQKNIRKRQSKEHRLSIDTFLKQKLNIISTTDTYKHLVQYTDYLKGIRKFQQKQKKQKKILQLLAWPLENLHWQDHFKYSKIIVISIDLIKKIQTIRGENEHLLFSLNLLHKLLYVEDYLRTYKGNIPFVEEVKKSCFNKLDTFKNQWFEKYTQDQEKISNNYPVLLDQKKLHKNHAVHNNKAKPEANKSSLSIKKCNFTSLNRKISSSQTSLTFKSSINSHSHKN